MWLLAVLPAFAHEPGLSRVEWRAGTLVLQVARVDAQSPADLLATTRVTVGGAPCTVSQADVRPDDNGFLATASVACPASGAGRVEAGWFDQLPPGHRTVLELGGKPAGWLDAGHRGFDIDVAAAGRVRWYVAALVGSAALLGGAALVRRAGVRRRTRSLS